MNISIDLIPDKKGYIDRKCPQCGFNFKVNSDDWINKIVGKDAYCPKCGSVDNFNNWHTDKQVEEAIARATNYAVSFIQKEMSKTFKQIEKETKNGDIRVTYTPAKEIQFTNNIIMTTEECGLEIICENCKTRYSTVENANICPCCGSINEK